MLEGFAATAAALGALIGVVLALTGAGGGILAVPLLVFVLDLPIAAAAPAGLMAVGMAAAAGALLGLREGIVRYRAAALIGACGMASGPLGVWLAQRLPNAPLTAAFALLLALTALQMWRGRPAEEPDVGIARQPCRLDPADGRLAWSLPCARALAATGTLSGLLSGLFGVGGGFVIVPALTRHTDLPQLSIIATSMAVITLVAAGSVAAAAAHGTLPWAVALPFAGGALLAMLAARGLARRLAGARLRRGFALVCFGVALLLLARAGGWLAW